MLDFEGSISPGLWSMFFPSHGKWSQPTPFPFLSPFFATYCAGNWSSTLCSQLTPHFFFLMTLFSRKKRKSPKKVQSSPFTIGNKLFLQYLFHHHTVETLRKDPKIVQKWPNATPMIFFSEEKGTTASVGDRGSFFFRCLIEPLREGSQRPVLWGRLLLVGKILFWRRMGLLRGGGPCPQTNWRDCRGGREFLGRQTLVPGARFNNSFRKKEYSIWHFDHEF